MKPFTVTVGEPVMAGRTPRGVRGLKQQQTVEKRAARQVAPLAGCVG